ncbi:MAG: prolipoprotein diacylglyceryl transferase [Crocinitomicaceae bacterium]
MNLAITWDVTPEIIDGWKTPNLYGLLFVTGLISAFLVVKRMYKREGMSEDTLDKLVIYMVLATIIGARLGHVFFYGPYFDHIDIQGIAQRGYFSHPLDIFKVWEGGLASHGGVLAILIAAYFYSKRVVKKPIVWTLDKLAAPGAIAACFIRLGNLVNSEIVGVPNDKPWAFSFPHYYNDLTHALDPTPRHPAQLYEAIAYLLIFFVMMYLYYKKDLVKIPGRILGWFLILLFSARFFIEFIKIGQAERDAGLFLNTGQWLSIPFVLVGIYLVVRKVKGLNEEKV